ncbi:MAG: NAD(+) diphosphatase [Woeseiaceae bacterium]|nr:NAD(+) diphosphatase [Woeseiaceae bacterium]
MKNFNVFAGAFVDRSGHRRHDPDWLARTLRSPNARFAPVWYDKCLVDGDPPGVALLPHAKVDPVLAPEESVFLGIFEGKPAFAFDIDCEKPPFPDNGQFHDLRYLGNVLPVEQANLVAHAIALINWHRLQKFCGLCGEATFAVSGGNTRRCSGKDCGEQIFPRVDPAIIVLVSHGEYCLLGRQASWPEGRYSTIAGFVEPGESLEDAVRREVDEETNVDVDAVQYHSSQPWPFPSSLMLGFTAEATSRDIQLKDGELEDAQWFTRKELRSGFPKLPFRLSIARCLVDGWLDEH